jgi:hypothetical protein
MKTVTLNADNRSVLVAEDADEIVLEADHIRHNNDRIYGLFVGIATLHEGVDVPSDWASSKYLFDGQDWSINPEYPAESGD